MATERIDIVVREDGSRVVKRNLDEVGSSGRKAGEGVEFLKRTLQGLAIGAALRFLQQSADAYTNITNRLKLVTTSTANLTAVNDALYASAQRTRISYEATANLYAKLALNAGQLGLSQKEMLGISEAVNQSIQVGGTNAQEAAAGLTQLAQALSSGTLRGDELRSILENMPRLARAIADGLGTTVGQLRILGAQGKLTSIEVARAIQSQAPKIAEEFAKITPTIGSSFTVLHNAVVKFIGDLNTSSGVAGTVAKAIIFLAGHLDSLITLVIGFGVAWTAVKWGEVASGLGKVTGAIRAMAAAIATNPIGLIAVAISLAIAALLAFGDRVKVTADGAISLKDAFFGALSLIRDFFQVVGVAITGAWRYAIGMMKAAGFDLGDATGDLVRDILGFFKVCANGIIGAFVFAYQVVTKAWGLLPAALKDLGVSAVNGLIGVVETGVNAIANFIRYGPLAPLLQGQGLDLKLFNIPRLKNDAQGAMSAVGDVVKSAAKDAFGTDYVGNFIGAAIDRARELKAQANSELPSDKSTVPVASPTSGTGHHKETRAEFLAGVARETAAATAQANVFDQQLREIDDKIFGVDEHLRDKHWQLLSPTEEKAMRDALKAMYEAQEVQKVRDDMLQRAEGPQKEYERHLTAAKQLLDAGRLSTEKYNDELRQAREALLSFNKDAASGIELGILKIMDEVEDKAKRMASAVQEVWQNANGPAMKYEDTLTAIQALQAKGLITAEQASRQTRDAMIDMLDSQTDAMSGFERAILKLQQAASDMATQVEGVITDLFKNAEDAFVEFTKTGKLSISGMIDGLREDLARMAFKQLFEQPILNAIGGAFGLGQTAPLNAIPIPLPVTMVGGLGGLGAGGLLNLNGQQQGVLSGQAATTTLGGWFSGVKTFFGGFFSTLTGIFSGVLGSLGGLFHGLVSGLGSIFSSIGSMLGGGGGGGGLGSILGLVGSFFGGPTAALSMGSPLMSFSGSALEGLGPITQDFSGLASLGFATGGGFSVGGSGGVDSQVVQFRATPGERVQINRPGQGGDDGGSTAVHLEVHIDARGATDPDAIERSVKKVMAEEAPRMLQEARRQTQQEIADLRRQRLSGR